MSSGCTPGMAFPSTVTKKRFGSVRGEPVRTKQFPKENKNGAVNTHREPLEGDLLSVFSDVPYAQQPATMTNSCKLFL